MGRLFLSTEAREHANPDLYLVGYLGVETAQSPIHISTPFALTNGHDVAKTKAPEKRERDWLVQQLRTEEPDIVFHRNMQ